MPPPAMATRKRLRPRPLPFLYLLILYFRAENAAGGVEILSKSRLERCVKVSDSDKLDCNKKVVVNVAVPSGASGGEASIVAELVEVEENATNKMQTIRMPPIITINKSAAYALYELTYIRDVPYKPEEFYVKTRKCEPDASAKVVQICERLRDQDGHIIEHTQPICCPCGPSRRVPSSCGNIFDKLMKGKANTAHCLRFPGDWFHVFGIGRRSLGFSVRIGVRKGSLISEVVVGPENRTAVSSDNFLRVSLVGDFVGYTSVPTFENFYLATPRLGTAGLSQNTGLNFSKWMLLERVRFTLDGLECNKIGVSYEAYNGQPNFCSSPLWSCLHNQLWNFWEADQNRISRNQPPQYVIEGRFERINQHPNAGTHSFSIGITEVLNTNLLIELSADDIDYVYQRSPGKITSIKIPTFEALTQFGTAMVAVKNIGKLEASYSLTFECLRGVSHTEEQFFIMKPDEVVTRSFKLYPTTDQAAKYECSAVLKDSDFSAIDRAECQFTTTATVLDNGSQITFSYGLKKGGINGFLEAIGSMWTSISGGLADFLTGKSCRGKCSGIFDFSCHIQYICISWIIMFGLLLAILPTVTVLVWLLHQKGFFDPLYDWWDDQREPTKVSYSNHRKDIRQSHACHNNGDLHRKGRHYHYDAKNRQKHHHDHRRHHMHAHSELVGIDGHRHSQNRYHLHVRAEAQKHKHSKKVINEHQTQSWKKGRPDKKRNPGRFLGQRSEYPLHNLERVHIKRTRKESGDIVDQPHVQKHGHGRMRGLNFKEDGYNPWA